MDILGRVVWMALGASVAVGQLAAASSWQSQSSAAIQPEAWHIVVLANQARAEAGAGALKWDPALAAAARKHCLRMAAEGAISHRYPGEPDPGARAAQTGARFSLIEENVALGPDPATIHQQWMHSPGHRTNLLNPAVDRVGVAVVAGANGLYAVADYAHGVEVLTQTQVEARIARMLQDAGLSVQAGSSTARQACATGKDPQIGMHKRFLMLWQDAELSRLPQELTEQLSSGSFHHAEVGNCAPQGDQGSFTAYRLAVLLE